MTKFAAIILTVSIGMAGIFCVQPTPAAAFTQIGQEQGKCSPGDNKACACKDTACAQRSDTSAKKGKPKQVLEIDGVKGESKDANHPSTMELGMRKAGKPPTERSATSVRTLKPH